MSCTTILVGKKATYDGSTIIARNDDSGAGHFTAKRFISVDPKKQPRHYESVISHVQIDLPDNPLRYTSMPNADTAKEGIWAAGGVNEANVAMTATETITSNERVLGADPLTENSGIGEEDLVVLTLPYIHSAREGVKRLGALHERYGTYEENGIGFADVNEVWWFESVGGHHWIARRVPDDAYVVMPNQLGIDYFDLDDALGEQKNFMCSSDLREFMDDNFLDLTLRGGNAAVSSDRTLQDMNPGCFNPRVAFGSHDDADHVYNTPRAWFMLRTLNPGTCVWDGPRAEYGPESDDLPWCMVPEHKVTLEDVKYVLSSHYQGTPFDPYASYGSDQMRGAYRSIGINRNDFLGCFQIRPYAAPAYRSIEWIAFASNAFNVMAPFYTNVHKTPAYLSNTSATEVSTDNFYWSSRLIAALSDACYGKNLNHIEQYQLRVGAKAHALIREYDGILSRKASGDWEETNEEITSLCESANDAIAAMLQKETSRTLGEVLFEASNHMKNQYARSDH